MLTYNPSLTFEIEPQRYYTPGSSVKGTLFLDTKKDVSVKDIGIKLVGLATSWNAVTDPRINPATGRTELITETGKEEEFILNESTVVFPPPEVKAVSKAEDLTILEGRHLYPFELCFPEGVVFANSTPKENLWDPLRNRQYYGFLGGYSGGTFPVTLPPSFEFNGYGSATVSYILMARLTRNKASNVFAKVYLRYKPTSLFLKYSLDHILVNKKDTLPDLASGHAELKYKITKAKRRSQKGIFKRLFDPRTVKVPFELQIDFSRSQNHMEHPISSGRVIQQQHNLNEYVTVSLLIPFSHTSLQDVLIGQSNSKETLGPLEFKITKIAVDLLEVVKYLGIKIEEGSQRKRVAEKNVNLAFELSDFEEVYYSDGSLLDKVSDDQKTLISPNKAFKLDLPKEIFEISLNSDVQSFVTSNIKNNVNLEITLSIANESNNTMNINCSTPIIMMPNDPAHPHGLLLEENAKASLDSPPPEYPPPTWEESEKVSRPLT